jgi:hypothetical protein
MEMTDAAGFGRPQPRPARELRPARIGGSASPAARQQSAIPVRIVRAGGAAVSGRPAGRPGALGLPQKVLISLMVVGTVVALIGSGSFATFNAATKNAPGITTGVLVLGDKVNAASECFSAGGASVSPANNTACTGVWSIATETPGTAISPLQMTIRNAGGIPASALSLYAAGACVNSHAGAGYDGTGAICSQVQLEIQQYTDGTFGTPLKCWYGSAVGASCLAEAAKLPAGCNVSTCTSYPFVDAANTLTNFGTTVTSGSPINVGAVSSGASAYFLVFASLPGSSGDSFQGRRADLTFTWLMVQ